MEKISSVIAYLVAAILACIGALTPQDIALFIGAAVAIGTFFVNWYYRRKSYRLLERVILKKKVFDELNH
ncbi:HP1 family phage holin [Yersinia alsatica]|uniref:HP1 family phage holin n=1 Tax=Yersinia alsatica TaxID=2890317 RepID=UPI00067B5650|nr:holin [Yersinia alsatica]